MSNNRIDALQKEHKEMQRGYGERRMTYVDGDALEEFEMQQFRCEVSDNFIRIIPPVKEGYYGFKIFVHRNMGPNNDAFLCPLYMKREHDDLNIDPVCPICEQREKLRADGAESDILRKFDCMPPRVLFFVVNVMDEKTEKIGPQLYDAPWKVAKNIIMLSKDRRSGDMLDVSDPDIGRVVVFNRTGTTKTNTEYSGFQFEEPSAIPDEWLAVPKFSEVIKFASVEQMKKSLYGYTPEDVEEDDENGQDEEPQRRRRRSSEPTEEERPRSRRERGPKTTTPDDDKESEEPKKVDRRRKRTESGTSETASDGPSEEQIDKRIEERLGNRKQRLERKKREE